MIPFDIDGYFHVYISLMYDDLIFMLDETFVMFHLDVMHDRLSFLSSMYTLCYVFTHALNV